MLCLLNNIIGAGIQYKQELIKELRGRVLNNNETVIISNILLS